MGQRLTGMTSGQKSFPVIALEVRFAQHGQSRRLVSELMPHTAEVADELCLVTFDAHRGHQPRPGHHVHSNRLAAARPAHRIGAWMSYGLGTENQDLPAFVVHDLARQRQATPTSACTSGCGGAASCRRSHQGVKFRSSGDPVLYLSDPPGVDREPAGAMLDGLAALNQLQLAETGDPEIATRIAQYELAFRMQTSVPELTDLSSEPEIDVRHLRPRFPQARHVRGQLPAGPAAGRARRAIRAALSSGLGPPRRPAEARFRGNAATSIRPTAALVTDLKQRGLLDDTLVVWGGEFGRTVYCQGGLTRPTTAATIMAALFYDVAGRRRHQARAWRYGETDDYSYNIVAGSGPHPRSERHDPALPGHRPQTADVPLPRPRLPPDRRAWPRGARPAGLTPPPTGLVSL